MIEAKIVNRGNCMLCGKKLSEDEGIFFCKECTGKMRNENNKRKKTTEYERGYKAGREDERIEGTYGMSVDDIQRYFGDIDRFKKMTFTERITRAYEDGYKVGKYERLHRKADAIDKIRAEIENIAFDWREIYGEHESFMVVNLNDVLQIIDKYKECDGND